MPETTPPRQAGEGEPGALFPVTEGVLADAGSSPPSTAFGALHRLLGSRATLAASLGDAEKRLAKLEGKLAVALSQSSGSLIRGSSPADARARGGSGSESSSGESADPHLTVSRWTARIALLEKQMNESDGATSAHRLRQLSPLVATLERAALEVGSLRDGSRRLEQRVATFLAASFEVVPERLSPSVAPMILHLLDPSSAVSEVFRLLRTKVQTLRAQRQLNCLGFISASPGEGKTTAALGLALSLAQERGKRVLLIEADLRKPSIEKYLGLSRRVGLGDWLRGVPGPLRVRRLEPVGLHFVSAGTPGGQPAELLRSARMGQLLEVARSSFDVVLVDCPPPFPFADSVILQELLDGFLFVVRGRHTTREEIRGVFSHLRQDSILGVVFNDFSELIPRFYTRGRSPGSYYYYGNQD